MEPQNWGLKVFSTDYHYSSFHVGQKLSRYGYHPFVAAKFPSCLWVTAPQVAACPMALLIKLTFWLVSSLYEYYVEKIIESQYLSGHAIFFGELSDQPCGCKVHAKVPPMPGSREARWGPRHQRSSLSSDLRI